MHPRRSVLMRVLGDVDAAPEIDTAIHDDAAGRPLAALLRRPQQLRLRRQDRRHPRHRPHRAGRRRPAGQGEPRPRRPRQRHGRPRRHRRQQRDRRGPPRRSSARRPRPLSFESDTARRPIRLPTPAAASAQVEPARGLALRAGARGIPRGAHRGGPPPRPPPPDRLAGRRGRRCPRDRRRACSRPTSGRRSHYFVGVDDGRVAIFQGVQQNIGPIELSPRVPGDHHRGLVAAVVPAGAASRRRSTPTTCATRSRS